MTQASGVSKSGVAWTDYHFMDTPHNGVAMTSLLTCLGCFCQFSGNIVELAQSLGEVEARVPATHLVGRGLCAFESQPQEQSRQASHAAGDREQTQGSSSSIIYT